MLVDPGIFFTLDFFKSYWQFAMDMNCREKFEQKGIELNPKKCDFSKTQLLGGVVLCPLKGIPTILLELKHDEVCPYYRMVRNGNDMCAR
uniref:AlNc14C173G8045 protein n=1 Tax=Albugo laibachii Nc14 TaxID=890382 RepID=F0WNM4_9STRA|nr:AlNc14C173G8045 [Albugo laibachii Nc14]|eukprot:CCA22915.1 AlNc14C173G8045 [Albugo laibachii Nc14]